MKRPSITRFCLAALLLGSPALTLQAQDSANPSCPWGHPPGYGRNLSPDERAAQRAACDEFLTTLREKQAQGSLTAEEQAWLERFEQRRGPGSVDRPRDGRGQGFGPANGRRGGPGYRDAEGRPGGRGFGPAERGGQRHRQGQGQGQGLRDGTGPRHAQDAPPAEVPPPPRGRR